MKHSDFNPADYYRSCAKRCGILASLLGYKKAFELAAQYMDAMRRASETDNELIEAQEKHIKALTDRIAFLETKKGE